MRVSQRRHRRPAGNKLPLMPFLSIMLGLMSVMALVTLHTAIQERQRLADEQVGVELTGVPVGFVPHEMRCKASGVEWRDFKGVGQFTPYDALQPLFVELLRGEQPGGEAGRLIDYLKACVLANRQLSFDNKQNTVILWVEPNALSTSEVISHIVNYYGWPLRVGMLPVGTNELIHYDATKN